MKGHNKLSPEPFLLQAKQPPLSQPFLIGDVFHPSDHFYGPPLDPLQWVHVFPVLRAPGLDLILQVGSHNSGVEGQIHLPWPAGYAYFDVAQDLVDLLGHERTLSSHVQLFHPPVLPSPSWQGWSQSHHAPASITTGDCLDPGAGPCTCPF